jgi:hypothetical protein
MITRRKSMKTAIFTACALALASSAASAQEPAVAGTKHEVFCITQDAARVITPNRHCSSSCKDWDDRQPVETLQMRLSDQWVQKGAFYRNAKVRCEGGDGCGYVSLGAPVISGPSASVTYKTWSIPVAIVMNADVCVLN